MGDQAMHSSRVIKFFLAFFKVKLTFFLRLLHLLQQLYARLSELLGLHDHHLMLNVIVGKIATNLKCYTEVKSFSCFTHTKYIWISFLHFNSCLFSE